jgi:hypothetical protein
MWKLGDLRRFVKPSSLLPSTDTLEETRRLHHADVSDLPVEAILAELVLIKSDLTFRCFHKVRPRVWTIDPDGTPIMDVIWLMARAERLRVELERRRRDAWRWRQVAAGGQGGRR